MQKLLILARSCATYKALMTVAALRIGSDESEKIPHRIVDPGMFNDASRLFGELSGWIDRELVAVHFPEDDAIVLVDEVNPDSLNPIASGDWQPAMAMLILAFPEVQWVFGCSGKSGNSGDDEWNAIRRWHGIKAFLSGVEGSPLFDGSGLRQWVLNKAKNGVENGLQLAPFIPIRKQWSAAIDDEASYAYLNAYICYRFGFRSWAVNSNRLFKTLFDESALPAKPADLTLEDFYLGFPDKESKVHYADLTERDKQLVKLKDVKRRYFVTADHQKETAPGSDSNGNKSYLRTLREAGRGGLVVRKPTPGIFTLWRETKLDRELETFDEEDRRRLGFAPGYIWPPCSSKRGSGDGHSAPGRLLQVSESLIARATRLINNHVDSVPQAVRGAVMASLAQELLGDRTPTTAREALELKHRFEVLAECQFGGVEFNINVNPRFEEINKEMHNLGEWFNHRRREDSLLNGELAIISRLMAIFRDHDELNEAEECRRKMRDLHRMIWLRHYGPSVWLFWPLRWYIEKLAGSLRAMCWMILLSLIVLVVMNAGYDILYPDPNKLPLPVTVTEIWLESISESVKYFVGGEPWTAGDGNSWISFKVIVSSFAALWGFLHLGILISHIYRLVSRT